MMPEAVVGPAVADSARDSPLAFIALKTRSPTTGLSYPALRFR
jgi:hypothetical protein